MQSDQGAFGPFLLKETKERVEEHDGQNGNYVGPFARHGGEHCGDDQDPDDQLFELSQKPLTGGNGRRLGQLVVTVTGTSLGYLGSGQPLLWAGERLQYRLHGWACGGSG